MRQQVAADVQATHREVARKVVTTVELARTARRSSW
jgi:hypothetical protein